jgi:hypothetical protein
MSEFKQELPRIGLSLEKGTQDVPDDGRYYVLVDGEIKFSSSSKKKASDHYLVLRDALLKESGRSLELAEVDPEETRRREREHYQMQAVRSESFERRMRLGWSKGGRGGRGGV